MSDYNSNKSRTQIIDLADDSSQPTELSKSDLQLINGGRWCICILSACSSAMGGGYDYD